MQTVVENTEQVDFMFNSLAPGGSAAMSSALWRGLNFFVFFGTIPLNNRTLIYKPQRHKQLCYKNRGAYNADSVSLCTIFAD